MESRLIARIAAATLAGVAIFLSIQQLREEQKVAPITKKIVFSPDGDPLATPPQNCSTTRQLASAVPDCRAAWVQKRRRFFGLAQEPLDDVMPPSVPDTDH